MIEESFIPQSFHPQLAQVFARFEHPVKIVTRYDHSDLGKDLQKFSSELSALTDKIAVTLEETADIPGMELFSTMAEQQALSITHCQTVRSLTPLLQLSTIPLDQAR